MKFRIFPVFIFDGDAPLEKHDAIKKGSMQIEESRKIRTNVKNDFQNELIKKMDQKIREAIVHCYEIPPIFLIKTTGLFQIALFYCQRYIRSLVCFAAKTWSCQQLSIG